MVITTSTPTVLVLPILTDDVLEKLMETTPLMEMEKPIWKMTCGEFIECLDEDYSLAFLKEETIGEAIGHLKCFKRDMESLQRYLNLNEIKETSEENQAKQGVVFPTFQETILITVAEFFHLRNFEEAEDIPFSNFLLINKYKTANAKFERNLNKIITSKSKMKK